MTDAREGVLEYALRELLSEVTSDLPSKVLRTLRESESAPEAPRRPHLWLAPAAGLILTLIVLKDRSSSPDPVVVATAQRALSVLLAGDVDLNPQFSFHVGDTLVNGPEAEHTLELVSGEVITLGPCSMLVFQRDESGLLVEPLVGQITVRNSAPSDLRVRTNLGTLALGEPGELQVERIADGYTLEQPERFQQLAKEIHMQSSTVLILSFITIISGSASLDSATGSTTLTEGEIRREQQDGFSSKEIKSKLLEMVGTWDLTLTQGDQTLTAEEIIEAGPGGQWIITDMDLKRGGRSFTVHTVVGYNPPKRVYTGTLYDSFGGEMGLLHGEVGEDLETRVLSMYSEHGTAGFDVRWIMTWISLDERHTVMEMLRGEEWVEASEIVHIRRK